MKSIKLSSPALTVMLLTICLLTSSLLTLCPLALSASAATIKQVTPGKSSPAATAASAANEAAALATKDNKSVTSADIDLVYQHINSEAQPVTIPASLAKGHGGTVKYKVERGSRTYRYCVSFSKKPGVAPLFKGTC